MNPHSVVYIVAKAPRPGACKTRLCPPLTLAEAADLAAAFVQDTLEMVRQAGHAARVICPSAHECTVLRKLLGAEAWIEVQAGQGLGDALHSAFNTGLGDGFDAVAVLGADSPTLPVPVIAEAFAPLDGAAEVTLGPTLDGGYYLLAARAVYPRLFQDMPWSTDRVAGETRLRCDGLGLRVHTLPTWFDVDDGPSLRSLTDALAQAPEGVAPHTRAALRSVADGRGLVRAGRPGVWA